MILSDIIYMKKTVTLPEANDQSTEVEKGARQLATSAMETREGGTIPSSFTRRKEGILYKSTKERGSTQVQSLRGLIQ